MNNIGWNTTDSFVNSVDERYSMSHQGGDGYGKKLIEKGLQKWADSAERYVNEKLNSSYGYNYNGDYGYGRYNR